MPRIHWTLAACALLFWGCGENEFASSGAEQQPAPPQNQATPQPTPSRNAPPQAQPQPAPPSGPRESQELPQGGENYEDYGVNAFVDAAEDRLLTFGADVDTASYTLMRRDITRGWLPNPAGVRVEEYVNFFDYTYRPPADEDGVPFAIHVDGAPSRFGEGLHLMRVGIKGAVVEPEERPTANLVFLVDVSGSMQSDDKLGLVKHMLTELTLELNPSDTVGIVTYAGREGVLLQPTQVRQASRITGALARLQAGGSTNGEAGIRAAYRLAEEAFREGGVNRVIICSDGDFNVGLTGDALIDLIEAFRERHITLSTIGFGSGNYNDRDMERLADHGNGNYSYVDSQQEVERIVGEALTSTLQVIAKDLKLQVDMNPEVVERYRLIGYENRDIADEDFRNDAVDSGDVGAGHDVTALIELELKEGAQGAIGTVQVRWKAPDGDVAEGEVRRSLHVEELDTDFDEASADLRFAAVVAEYAEILRHSPYVAEVDWPALIEAAEDRTRDLRQKRAEFTQLLRRASSIWNQ